MAAEYGDMSRKRSDLPMTVQGLAKQDVVTAPPDASIEEVARAMFERNVGSVVIVDGEDQPTGIVTDRDLTIELLAEDGEVNLFASDVNIDDITATEVMTTEPLTVTTEDELPRVLHHMTDAHARRIPVVDPEGRLAGILTLDDVIIHLAGESTHVSAQLDNVAGIIRSESPK